MEESTLSSKVLGFGVLEESTLSSKVLGNGRKYAFFESFGEWKKVRFLLEYFGFGGFGRKYAFF
jgi:hypothetical protein